jgi:hypothetical protein
VDAKEAQRVENAYGSVFVFGQQNHKANKGAISRG